MQFLEIEKKMSKRNKKLLSAPDLDTISRSDSGTTFTLSAKAIERFKIISRVTDSCIIKRNFLFSDNTAISGKMLVNDIPDAFRFPTMFFSQFLGMVTAYKRAIVDFSKPGQLMISNQDNLKEYFTICQSDERYITVIPEDAKIHASEKCFKFTLESSVLCSILDKSKIINAEKVIIRNATNHISIKSKMNIPNAPEYEQTMAIQEDGGLSAFVIKYATLRQLDSSIDYQVEVYEQGMHLSNSFENVDFYVGALPVDLQN